MSRHVLPEPADSQGPLPIAALTLRERVPYITSWSGEETPNARVVRRGHKVGSDRIAYANERRGDRDANGVLWRRMRCAPGRGRPLFAKVHPIRQRRAIGGLWCQVCGQSAAREATADGVLFLLGAAEYETGPWPEPIDTTHPPLCVGCAAEAVSVCPHLRNHYVALRARTPRVHAVSGSLCVPKANGQEWAFQPETVPLAGGTDWRLRFLQASQLVLRLSDYTLVDLEAEAEALIA